MKKMMLVAVYVSGVLASSTGTVWAASGAAVDAWRLGPWFVALCLAMFGAMLAFLFLLEKTDPRSIVSNSRGILISLSVLAFLVASFVLAVLGYEAGFPILGSGCLFTAIVFACRSIAQHDRYERAYLSGLVFLVFAIALIANCYPLWK